MRSRRNLLLAAAAAGSLLALAACGAPAAPSSSSSTSQAASSAAAEPVEVSFWHIQTTGDGPKLIDQAVQRFQKDNPNITVKVTGVANDAYKDKIKVALGANDAPCIFPTWGGGPLAAYIKADQVIALDDLIAKDNYKDRFVPASWTNVTFDGKSYGVPVENSAVAVIWYNKATFAKYNLTPPATWAEFTKVAETLKAAGVAPISLANKPKWPGIMWYDYFVARLGGGESFSAAALRTGGKFTDEPFVKAAEMVQSMVDKGWIASGFNSTDYDSGGSRKLLYSGKAAMELMGNWEYSIMVGDKKASEYGFFPFPAIEGGKGDPTELLGTIGDNYYSISKSCKNPEAAFKVIQYLIDDESVKARVAAGRIPPVAGVKVEDPILQQLVDLMAKSKGVQLWWDQYMPPDFAQLHLNEVQALFGKTETPQAFAQKHEDLAAKLLG